MPILNTTTEVFIDFDIFCATCGVCLCSQSETRISRSRSEPQVIVKACQNCLENARNEIREEMQKQIDELKDTIIELEDRIQDLYYIRSYPNVTP